MATASNMVNRYLAAWNERDATRRQHRVADAWAVDGSYRDPLMRSSGHGEITDMIGAAQRQFPDLRFELSTEPDAYGENVRFSWKLVPTGGGATVAAGTDFATVADDGRLRTVTGFIDLMPTSA